MTEDSGEVSRETVSRVDVDLRDLVASPIMHQGARPLCLPITISHAHEGALVAAREDAALAPEAIWWACAEKNQVWAGGMFLEHAGLALQESGQPPLSQWPWNPHLGIGTEKPPSIAGIPPWTTAELLEVELAHDGVEDEIEDALADGRAIVLVVEVTDEFDYPDEDGLIAVPDVRSAIGDMHAVLILGAVTGPDKTRRLLVRNSWGEFWGTGGYGWLPLDYLVANAIQAAIVVPS